MRKKTNEKLVKQHCHVSSMRPKITEISHFTHAQLTCVLSKFDTHASMAMKQFFKKCVMCFKNGVNLGAITSREKKKNKKMRLHSWCPGVNNSAVTPTLVSFFCVDGVYVFAFLSFCLLSLSLSLLLSEIRFLLEELRK